MTIQYESGGFHPSDYKDLPIYRLVSLYKQMRGDGLELGLDPRAHLDFDKFSSIDEALGRCARIYSSIVAYKEAEEEIEDFGLFKPSPKPQKVVKVKSTPKGVDREDKGFQMSKAARSKVPMNAVITVLIQDNPKKRTAAERFAKYRSGMTVQEFVDAIGSPTLAVNDILWDTDKGWIKYEIPATESDENVVQDEEAA